MQPTRAMCCCVLLASFCVLGLVALMTTGCGDLGPGGDNDTAPAQIDNRTVFINPDDPMLYSFSVDSGEVYTYYGHRDEAGLATAITMLDYIDAGGNAFTIFYDTAGLPAKITDAQGAVLDFEYHYNAMQAKAAEGGFVHTATDGSLMAIDSIGVAIRTTSDGIPSEVKTLIALDEPVVFDLSQEIADAQAADPSGNICINIEKCGEPVSPPDGAVRVGVRRLAHHAPTYYPAYPTSQQGRFISSIPQRTPEALPQTAEAICTSFADTLSSICTVYNPVAEALLLDNPAFQALFCLKVTAAISLAAPEASLAAGSLCNVLIPAGTAACKTLGWGPKGAPDNVMQKLCGQVEEALKSVDSASGLDTAMLQAVVDFSVGSPIPLLGDPDSKPWVFTSEELNASAYGPFPELNISATEPSIDRLVISPALPTVSQGYGATADMSCVSGLDLSISVTREGLPLAETKAQAETDKKSISVSVPAAPAGQIDVVLVTVSSPSTGAPLAKKELTVMRSVDTSEDDPSETDVTVFFPCPDEFSTREEGTWPLLESFEIWNNPPFFRYACRYAQPEGAHPWTGEMRGFTIAWCTEPNDSYVGCGVPPENPGQDLPSDTHKAFVSTSAMTVEPLAYQEDVLAFREVLLKIVEDGVDEETQRRVQPAGAWRCE